MEEVRARVQTKEGNLREENEGLKASPPQLTSSSWLKLKVWAVQAVEQKQQFLGPQVDRVDDESKK